MNRALELVTRINGALAVVTFGALTAVVALQVFTRFVLHTPVIWSEEAARFLFFWTVLLGSALSVRYRRHFVIDINPGRAMVRDRGWVTIAANAIPDLAILFFSVFLLLEGIDYVEIGSFRIGTNSRVNMAVVYAAIPTFAALTILYSLNNLIEDVRLARQGRMSPIDHPPAD